MATITKKTATKKQSTGKVKSDPSTTSRKGVSHQRELINTGTNKRYTRSDANGHFKDEKDAERSLSQANDHMERVWEKIYERREKKRKAA